MPGTSGPSLPVPFGFYDPGSGSLRTSQGTFDSASTLSCATLPPSGSMRSGALYARRRSALPTAASACSSSPGLPTPRARDSRGRGFEDGLPNVAMPLLPTPRTSDTNGSGAHGDGGPDLRTAVTLLPTPRASDGGKYDALPGAVVHLLPTPTARLGDPCGRSADPARYKGPKSLGGRRSNLDDAVAAVEARSPWLAHLLPTPTAADGERESTTYGRGNPTLRGALTAPPSHAGKRRRAEPPPGQLTLADG